MSWWGKILGGAFGYSLGGPLGALLGAVIGHQFDAGLKRMTEYGGGWSPGDQERTQTAFFTSVFSVMGHMAKVDGRVSEQEIAMARSIMQQMALNAEQQRVAIDLFQDGKRPDFPLDEILEQFRRECHGRRTLVQMFLEILLHAGYADGKLDGKERALLFHISDRLHFPRHLLEQLDAMVQAQQQFHGYGHRGQQRAGPSRPSMADAYTALGVKSDSSDAEVKKAYRRLMNQHHPDKLVAKGLPEEMINVAKEKTQEIQAAYEQIKEARGMK